MSVDDAGNKTVCGCFFCGCNRLFGVGNYVEGIDPLESVFDRRRMSCGTVPAAKADGDEKEDSLLFGGLFADHDRRIFGGMHRQSSFWLEGLGLFAGVGQAAWADLPALHGALGAADTACGMDLR